MLAKDTPETRRFSFTKATLIHLLEGSIGERLIVHDTKTPGLIAELRPGGTLTFYLYRRIEGRPARVRIGPFPAVNVEQARKQVQRLVGDIAKGIDPRDKKRARRNEATLGELCAFWIEAHAKPRKRTWPEDQRLIDTFLTGWRSRRLSDVTKADVQALHTKIGAKNGKYAANRLLALLGAMFGVADQVGFTGLNPAVGIKKYREQSRERFLSPEELPRFFDAVQAEPDSTLSDFFLLALFTGARRGNLQAMRWEDVDLHTMTWRIPRTKSGDPVSIHLSAPALEILRRRHAYRSGPWVLPGRGESGHLQEPKAAWKRICARAGLQDLRIHDLRRTLGSWQAATGASLPIIGKTLGHKTPQATAVYSRLDIDPVRQAVDTAVTAMLGTVKAADKAGGSGDGKE